jgi:hypothetical protein
VVFREREISLRDYYFEDDGQRVEVTFPLPGIGDALARRIAPRERRGEGVGDDEPSGATAAVAFGARGGGSFEVTIRGYRASSERTTEASSRADSPPSLLRFACRKTYGVVVPDACDWRARKDKLVVRLFKDPEDARGRKPWPRIFH